jgi:putative endonuclease
VKAWYLYLIRCGDGSIYTGVSTDVSRRLAEHRCGKGARYLRGRGPLLLARKIRVGGKSDAFKMEWRVKKLSPSRKKDLIKGKIRMKDLLYKMSRRKGKKLNPKNQILNSK